MGTTIDRLKAANGLDDNRIFVGQQLDVPLGS
jgi:LysM repeat protein